MSKPDKPLTHARGADNLPLCTHADYRPTGSERYDQHPTCGKCRMLGSLSSEMDHAARVTTQKESSDEG